MAEKRLLPETAPAAAAAIPWKHLRVKFSWRKLTPNPPQFNRPRCGKLLRRLEAPARFSPPPAPIRFSARRAAFHSDGLLLNTARGWLFHAKSAKYGAAKGIPHKTVSGTLVAFS
jgi:hypothetical protein